MTYTFVCPSQSAVPPVLPEEHIGNRLFRYFKARPEGINVYLYKVGSASAAAHGRVDEDDPVTLYDANGVAISTGWSDLEMVFWGGCQAVTITQAQADALRAAGYTVTTGPSTAPPTITSIAPSSGVVDTVVTLTGTGFLAVDTVTVGGIAAMATLISDTTLLVLTPAHADGVVNVVVTTSYGVAQIPFTYATPAVNAPPAITALSPTSGVAGASVTVTGTNFAAATDVKFDGVSATFVINSATQITATAPTHADAAITVTVTDANGTGAGATFTYATPPAPIITSVSPSSGVATTLVTLTGTTFNGTTSVTVDGASVSFTQVSATQVTFVAPTHVDAAVAIVLTTANGSDSDTFTYSTPPPASPPALTTLVASSGPTSGGSPVVITGTSMNLTTQVTFAGTAVAFTINSPTQVTCTAPAHAAGSVPVVVNSNNGPSNALTFVYADADPHPGSDLLLEDGSFLLLEDATSSLQQES